MLGALIELLTLPISTVKVGIWCTDGLRKFLALSKVSDQRKFS